MRGIDGLRVIDCSIMPTIVSGNTNAPAMAIGSKAASLIASIYWPRGRGAFSGHQPCCLRLGQIAAADGDDGTVFELQDGLAG